MKGRDFGYNDSYESFDRESFDPTLVGVFSRTPSWTPTQLQNLSITKFMRSYLGPEKFNETNFVEDFHVVFCRAKPDKLFFDKCLCLKLLRILSKNICRGFFFC